MLHKQDNYKCFTANTSKWAAIPWWVGVQNAKNKDIVLCKFITGCVPAQYPQSVHLSSPGWWEGNYGWWYKWNVPLIGLLCQSSVQSDRIMSSTIPEGSSPCCADVYSKETSGLYQRSRPLRDCHFSNPHVTKQRGYYRMNQSPPEIHFALVNMHQENLEEHILTLFTIVSGRMVL